MWYNKIEQYVYTSVAALHTVYRSGEHTAGRSTAKNGYSAFENIFEGHFYISGENFLAGKGLKTRKKTTTTTKKKKKNKKKKKKRE